MTLEIDVVATPADVGAAGAAAVTEALAAARARGARPLIGWPVGRTPRPIVTALSALARQGRLDLHDAAVVLMDDFVDGDATAGWRRIPEDQPHSCRGTAVADLVEPLQDVLAPERRLPVDGLWSPDPTDPGAYDERIAAAGGIELFVVALGSGDGHIALNPPGSDPASRTRVLQLADSTRNENLGTFPSLDGLAAVPAYGVTVGLATITAARRLIVLAHGDGKRAAVAQLLAAPGFLPELPMTVVLGHPRVRLVCDEAAAGTAAPARADQSVDSRVGAAQA